MKILLSHLNDFVDLKGVEVNDLAEKLSKVGFEVEEIINAGAGLENVVSCKILEIKQHENADKLVVCKVDKGDEITQIVTGAKNMKEGDFVPLALDGALLPCGIAIKNSVIRGEESKGMFCGGEEIGVTEEMYKGAGVNGLLILRGEPKPGTPIADVLGLNDVILDVNITPNRPDAGSVLGIAREVAAIYNKKLKMPSLNYKAVKENYALRVTIENGELCPRYMGAYIKNVKNVETPEFIKKRLKATGHGLHSFYVDITNYVLMEIGQPMHAFDASKIGGNKIVIRNAKSGEKIVTLDEKTRELKSEMLVIADSKNPLVIAGIMGGTESGTYETTKEIFLESAIFNYANIRKTSRALGLTSDSSSRFSKGVYFESACLGLKRALSLISQFGAGDICEKIIDEKKAWQEQQEVLSSVKRINERLALNIPADKMVQILNSLDIKTSLKGDTLKSIVPFHRTDITGEVDICEEVGRFYGYDEIDEKNTTATNFVPCGTLLSQQKNINLLKDVAIGDGANEIITFQFITPKWLAKMGINTDNLIEIQNPLGKDFSLMRNSLVPAMLETIAVNQKRRNNNLFFFELAHVFIPNELPLKKLPYEPNFLCFGLNAEGVDFYDLKNTVNKIARAVNVNFDYRPSEIKFMHPGICADIWLYNRKIGFIGQVHPKVNDEFEINKPTFVAEIDVSLLLERDITLKIGAAVSKTPDVERDLALVVSKTVLASQILNVIKSAARGLISSAEIFDVYEGSQLPQDKKSVAVKIYIKQNDKTLSESEIAQVVDKILNDCKNKLGASLR